MKRFSLYLLLLTCLQLPGISHAFTAVSVVKGHALDTIYAVWDSASQTEANTAALEGCRTEARKNGLSQLAKNCVIFLKQKGGGGAIVCGSKGCATSVGFDTAQDAVDDAYQKCEHDIGECQKTGITSWWDDVGVRKQTAEKIAPAKTCGPPPGKVVHSTYQCNNGDCTRTFDNGCTVRFEATYCHDPFSGNWEWKPDGC